MEALVRLFLRGQNLEHVRRTEEAIELYEQAVAAGFDAAGPYDRLIAIYRGREAHAEVVRVASAALASVRTFEQKLGWYREVKAGAEARLREQPDATGAEF